MLCISEDDYSDSEHVHIGKFAAPRPHIQADLYKLGREIQRILMEEPGYTLNLCKLREKYEFFYGKPLDKLGYSKLVDCVYALPEPITTRNVRPNGVALLMMRPMRDSCKAFQRGQCKRRPDECDCEHECDLCGYPTHGASQCVDEGAPDTKPVQSYTHCCLRSKCVGDIHNPDVYVPDADDLILADLSVNSNRFTVESMLQMRDKYQSPPVFTNPGLECVNGRPNLPPAHRGPAPRRPRTNPPLDEKQLKIRAFYAHFIAWLNNRYRQYQDWPRNREDFSFEWESYLSGNREMRQTVVALIDFAPSAALVYLSAEVHVVAIVNLTELVWSPTAVSELLEITGAAPPPSRRWSQSSNQWGGEPEQPAFRARNPAPRPWASQLASPPTGSEASPVEPVPVAEQKVIFTISKSNDIQDPPSSSKVWRPESPERYTSKIPIPTSSRYIDDDEDEDENEQSLAWSTSWRPKPSDYAQENQWGSSANGVYSDANGQYSNGNSYSANGMSRNMNDDDDEEGAINEDEEEEEGAINEEEEGAINEDQEYAANNIADDAVVDSSYDIQHEYYEEAVQSTHQQILHDNTSHMDNIANAYASDSASDDEVPDDHRFQPEPAAPIPTQPAQSSIQASMQEPISWNEPRTRSSTVNSSFSALFGDSAPSQQLLPEQPFVAALDSGEPDFCQDEQLAPAPSADIVTPVTSDEWPADPDIEPNVSLKENPASSTISSPVLSAAAPEFVHSSESTTSSGSAKLSPSAPEFNVPSDSTPRLSVHASEFVAPQSDAVHDDSESEAAVDSESKAGIENGRQRPDITIDNKIVVGDVPGQNYRRMNDIVSRASDFAFRSDVSSSEVVNDMKRLGLAEGSAPNMTWNSARVQEIESFLNPRAPSFEPTSHPVASENEEFLKNLLYQAVLGIRPPSSEEVHLFICECLRLQNAGVESVIAGMRSLWLPSRASSSGSGLFQAPPSRPVITNEAHSPIPLGVRSSTGTSRLAPSTMREFLQEADLGRWLDVFEDQEIGFEVLPDLIDEDLVELGMVNARERQRFHDAVRILKTLT